MWNQSFRVCRACPLKVVVTAAVILRLSDLVSDAATHAAPAAPAVYCRGTGRRCAAAL